MAGREISVKKYVVKLSAEERERLEAMICAGKHPAQSLTKARILLKADVSEAGEGWSDSAISAALDTSINNIGRTRRRLVEEGIAAALTRKHNPNSARPRIFDGVAEAKLIALTCSPAPEGFARWSLRLLEEKVRKLLVALWRYVKDGVIPDGARMKARDPSEVDANPAALRAIARRAKPAKPSAISSGPLVTGRASGSFRSRATRSKTTRTSTANFLKRRARCSIRKLRRRRVGHADRPVEGERIFCHALEADRVFVEPQKRAGHLQDIALRDRADVPDARGLVI